VQEFEVSPNIAQIAVDFRTGVVYGMTGDKSDMIKIQLPGNTTLNNCGAACKLGTLPRATTIGSSITVPDSVFPRPLPTAMRLTGFFITPEGDQAFVSDRASSGTLSEMGYTAAIYRASDTNLLDPVARLPVDAVSFSK
jgi:hypothetical protein